MRSGQVGTTEFYGSQQIVRSAPAVADWPSLRKVTRAACVRSVATNVLVSSFYALFLYSSVKFWLATGSLVGSGLVIFNTSVVAFLLARRRPTAVTTSRSNWLLAPSAAVLPLLLRPVESAGTLPGVVTSIGQIAGLVIMVASLAALNRSLGIVAANRGIKTGGPYAWVRHPLYSGEILFLLSFLVSHWNYLNALIVFAVVLLQVVRSLHEEAVLALDQQYRNYRNRVRYRLLPWVF